MKHLFYIHSPITELSAKQTIREEGLGMDSCRFILANGHLSPSLENAVQFPFAVLPKEYAAPRSAFWDIWRKMREIDQWINFIIDNEFFTYYLPHSNANFQHLIIKHPLCKAYCYIEEGTLAYYYENMKPSKKPFFLRDAFYRLCYKGRSPSVKPYIDFTVADKFKGCYCFSEHAFTNAPGRRVLPFPASQDVPKDYPHCPDVLVLGPFVEFGHLPMEIFLDSVSAILEYIINNGIRKICYKPHPRQIESTTHLNALFSKYKDRLEIRELGSDIILEYISLTGNVRFYMLSSSVAIYASFGKGNQIISAAQYAARQWPDFRRHLDSMPSFVAEKTIFI